MVENAITIHFTEVAFAGGADALGYEEHADIVKESGESEDLNAS